MPRLFADDTCLVIYAANPTSLRDKMNSKLKNVAEWTQANKITVNPQKPFALIIPPKIINPISNFEVFFQDNSVPIKEFVKYLGITIDSRLNIENYISTLASKVSRSVGELSKLRHVLPSAALCNLYYSLIHSQLLQGITIWGNTYDKYLKRLILLQNKAVRIVARGRWRDHATPH